MVGRPRSEGEYKGSFFHDALHACEDLCESVAEAASRHGLAGGRCRFRPYGLGNNQFSSRCNVDGDNAKSPRKFCIPHFTASFTEGICQVDARVARARGEPAQSVIGMWNICWNF
jgi:hypothetical protein